MPILESLEKELKELKNSVQAKIYQKFFKTAPGEYGEGDVFLGIKVPILRRLSKKYKDLKLKDLEQLVSSKFHEKRMIALYILILKYDKGDEKLRKEYYDFYIRNMRYVNNWDLIDTTAMYIVGRYLEDKPKNILYEWAKSNNLWKKRIAIMSTFLYIKKEKFEDTLNLAEIMISDEHDLIQKAVGWMLREIGNRNLEIEEEFLKKYYKKMPRTMLRYAIEKFEKRKRQFYLKGEV